MINQFKARTSNDSQVYITQIGNDNKITVQQTGTKNNYVYVGLEYGLYTKKGGIVCLDAKNGKEIWKDII